MNKTNNIFDKMIYYSILFFPILDIITSIMTYNGISISAGLVVKALVMGLVFIYCLFSKNISKFSKILLIIYSVFICGSIANNYEYVFPIPNFEYLKLIIKFSYFIVFTIFFTDYLKNKNYDLKILKTPIKIILLSMFIAMITGTAMPSYNNIYKVGIEGWFYSANEVGGLLTLLYPISLYLFFHDEYSKKIEYIYIIFHATSLLMLGTKVGLIGFFAVTIIYIIYRLIFIKKYSYKNGLVIIAIVLACSFFAWDYLPCVINTGEKYGNVSNEITNNSLSQEEQEENKNELVNEMIYSGRHNFLEELKSAKKATDKSLEQKGNSLKSYSYKKIANDYLGYMYMSNGNLLLIERDFHDTIFFFGKFGLFLLLFVIVFPIIKNIKNIIKNFFDLKLDMLLLSIAIILGIAFISGHTLISPMVSFYIAVVLGVISNYKNTKEEYDKSNLLISTVHMGIGGIETSLVNLLDKIDYKKYNVDLFLLLNKGENFDKINKKVTIFFPYNRVLSKIINSDFILFKLIKNILFNRYFAYFYTYNKKYDVAIDYSGYHLFIDYFVKNSNASRKLIWVHTDLQKHFENSIYYQKKIKIHKAKYNCFDKIVCVSKGAKQGFKNLVGNFNDRLTVMYNIVTLDNNEKVTKLEKLKGDYKILSVGRLTKEKNHKLLIETHKKLVDDGYKIHTYIIGDGDELESLQQLINNLNVNDSCKLLGAKTNIKDYLKQADLFVLTSLYEAFGIVLIESLYCGVPFIAPNINGVKEIQTDIAPENSSLLVNADINGFYQGIKEAINNKITKNFRFDINEYNSNNINDFEKLLK